MCAALVVALVASCVGVQETTQPPPPPDEVVASFLAAASGGEADRGWSLLHPVTRAEMFGNDREAYIASAGNGAWDSFTWEIHDVVPDDPSLYFVYLQLDGSDVPPILTDSRNNLFLIGPLDPRNPVHMGVRYDDTGTGIWAKGG